MEWIISLLTIASVELLARKRWEGWAVGIVNQGLWVWLAISGRLWGLLPMAGVLTWQFSVALIRWRREKEKACVLMDRMPSGVSTASGGRLSEPNGYNLPEIQAVSQDSKL